MLAKATVPLFGAAASEASLAWFAEHVRATFAALVKEVAQVFPNDQVPETVSYMSAISDGTELTDKLLNLTQSKVARKIFKMWSGVSALYEYTTSGQEPHGPEMGLTVTGVEIVP